MNNFIPPSNTSKTTPIKTLDGKRYFLSPTYIRREAKDVYQGYRKILIEELNPDTGQVEQYPLLVNGNEVESPYAGLMCKASSGEPVVSQTFDSEANEVIYLTILDKEQRERAQISLLFPTLP